ncbi:MAG: dihydrofolate reductase [Planctomycetota bacterium]|nr:MAG: dihydrofolate reductase [Planctomycetota bacterium]
MARRFAIVVAADEAGGIGRGGGLPWRLRGDLVRFRELTTGAGRNTVIMGRRTWESLPPRFRPLPGRRNIVLTRTGGGLPEGILTASSLAAGLELADPGGEVFVIGGAEVYAAALADPNATVLHLTRVLGDHGCDVRVPALAGEPHGWREEWRSPPQREDDLRYLFLRYRRS